MWRDWVLGLRRKMQSFEIIFRDIRSDVNFYLEKNVRTILSSST